MRTKNFYEWMLYIGNIYYAQIDQSRYFIDAQISETIKEMEK